MTALAETIPDGFEPVVMPLPTRPGRQRPALRLTDTNALMSKDFDPIRWVVPDYLPEGFAVLAGRQKLGKTWLAIDLALAVATGGIAMGAVNVDEGDVLYVDLENGERRIQRRITAIFPNEKRRPDLSRLTWATEAPALDKGLVEALERWRVNAKEPRLVVIDVLQRVKPIGSPNRNSYENDYSAWSPLQTWAMENGVAVLGLHHTRKGGADDPLEALSGSNGLSACADTTLVLDRDGNGTTLYVRGRDVDEKESALQFNAGLWLLVGDAAKARLTSERSAILAALAEAEEPLNPSQIAVAANAKRNNVDRLLGKMSKDAEVLKAGRGRYVHPDRTDLLDPGKNGKKVGTDAEAYRNKGLGDT